MITLKVDQRSLNKSLNQISKSLQDLPKTNNMYNVTRAVASIAAQKFVRDANAYARLNRKSMHHLYEWNEVGRDKSRLFVVHRGSVSGNRVNLEIIFKKSRTKVPISKVLQRRGRTGKSVTKTGVFRDKAEIMESGKSVRIFAKNTMAFSPDGRRIVFRSPGQSVFVKNPGGTAVRGAMKKYAKSWQSSMLVPAVESSGIFNRLEKQITRTMSKDNYTSVEVSEAIKSVCNRYDSGKRDF